MKRIHLLASGAAVVLLGAACQNAPSDSGGATPSVPSEANVQASSLAAEENIIIAQWSQGGEARSLTLGQLKAARKSTFAKLERDRYNAIRRELESFVLDQLMEAEAEAMGKTQEAYIEGLAAQVPEAKVKKFYETTVAKGGDKGPSFEDVEPRIRQYLSMRDEVERVKTAASFQITLPEPETPIATFDLNDRPRKGPADAKVTIVEFSDFQCPYCARATQPVEEIAQAFPDDVSVYFLHFPLSFHEQAMPAALASRCAQQQGKFWEMHDKIFENQSEMTEENIQDHAKALELKMEDFKSCLKDPATEAFVRSDMAQGTKAGVAGTPSFYINGKQHQGPPTVETIRAIVEEG